MVKLKMTKRIRDKLKLIPVKMEIEAYECSICKAILYVSTPDKYTKTFTKKQIEKHIRKRVTPPLPKGLVFAPGDPLTSYGIILDGGRLIQGTLNSEGFLGRNCYVRELAHSYEHQTGIYLIEEKIFCDKVWSIHCETFSRYFKRDLGKKGHNLRLLTPEEFNKISEEFEKLKSNPRVWSETHKHLHSNTNDIEHFLSLEKLIRTTPELDRLISRRK